jgi:hypothetical protein
MTHKVLKKTDELLKTPVVLEEFLFLNPDTAVAFNNLPLIEQNHWIVQIRAIKNIQALENLLKTIKEQVI